MKNNTAKQLKRRTDRRRRRDEALKCISCGEKKFFEWQPCRKCGRGPEKKDKR